MKGIKLLALALAGMMVVVLAAGCAGGSSKTPAASEGGIAASGETPAPSGTAKLPTHLRFPGSDPLTLDPHRVTDAGSHQYVGLIFSGLLKLNLIVVDENGNTVGQMGDWANNRIMTENVRTGKWKVVPDPAHPVLPDLAASIPEPEFNEDGTVSYTFTIRDDAKFASGLPVTAYHFAYSFERAADPRTRSTTAEMYLGDIIGVQDMLRGKIPNRVSQDPDITTVLVDLPGVEVLDAKTLRITIDSFKPYFLMKLTYPTAYVVDKVQVESVANWLDRPNGTGPYRMVERVPGVKLVLEPNPNYYGHKAALKIVYEMTGGASFPRYKQGELDIAGIGIADLEVLKDARDPSTELGKQYYQNVEMSTSYIGFNTLKPPFDDVKVRQAFAMSVDKKALASRVLYDLVIPAEGILPPGMPGHREGYQGLPYDPEKAKQLLKESKYGSAKGLGRIKLLVSGSGGQEPITLQSIVEMWRTNLGVEVEFEQIDYATFLEEISKGKFQMFSLGWVADYPDPEDFLDLKFYWPRSRANNETGYNNARVNELLLEARTERDPARRTEIYWEVEDIIVHDAPWLVLFHGKRSTLIAPYLCGYIPAPMGIPVLHYVTICDPGTN